MSEDRAGKSWVYIRGQRGWYFKSRGEGEGRLV